MTPTPINRDKRVNLLKEREPNKYRLYKAMLETNKGVNKVYTPDESIDFIDTLSEEEAKEILKTK